MKYINFLFPPNSVEQHDRRLESRFRVLEDRAFHRGSEELALADKLSLQEDWFTDNLYSESPTNGPVSELLKLTVFVCLAYSISVHTAVRSPSVLELG